jgi:hypothetical protein
MTDPSTIRELLRRFLGDMQYRKFVANVPRTHEGTRLLFWQERELEKFQAASPSIQMTFSDVVAIFRICQLHGCELRQTRIPVVKGCVDFVPEFWESRNRDYPNAPLPFISTEGRDMNEADVSIWCCPKCEEIQRDSQR